MSAGTDPPAEPVEELLHGGVANAGAVVRVGDHVLRPSNPHTASVHATLADLRRVGFEGASNPVGVDGDGRERLEFIEGDVPVPPYPPWARTDAALASMAVLIRRLHDASTRVDLTGRTWNDEAADPLGGPVLCHNDVCLENVVFRDGEAVALLDFDYAAPGRPVFDLASFARMTVPIDDEVNSRRLGWAPADEPSRLRLVADAYGLREDERGLLLPIIDEVLVEGAVLVRRRVTAGDPGFVRMWQAMGGEERFERRQRWWSARRGEFERALQPIS